MTENRRNTLRIVPKDTTMINFTEISHIEFYVKQGEFFRQYTPLVVDASTMLVEIPVEDAIQLTEGQAVLQFAYTDANGNPQNSTVRSVTVDRLLKKEGYSPV